MKLRFLFSVLSIISHSVTRKMARSTKRAYRCEQTDTLYEHTFTNKRFVHVDAPIRAPENHQLYNLHKNLSNSVAKSLPVRRLSLHHVLLAGACCGALVFTTHHTSVSDALLQQEAVNPIAAEKILSNADVSKRQLQTETHSPQAIKPHHINAASAAVASTFMQTKQLLGVTPEQKKIAITVSSGDQMIGLLTRHGVSNEDAHQLINYMSKEFNPRNLRAGQRIALTLRQSEVNEMEVEKLGIRLSGLEHISLKRQEDGSYACNRVTTPLTTRVNGGQDTIKSSFYISARNIGLSERSIAEMIKALSYDVDFQRDIHAGDTLKVLFEERVSKDGSIKRTGNVLYAQLTTGGRNISIYRHKDAEGNVDYYNEKGESLRKALLKTPINGARVSSGFGMRRHPVLGFSKMHKGTDFAAATGTPIYAAGDGVVKFAGSAGSYGNYVKIQHNATYSSAYAHASRIASGIRPGTRVKQGQVIAYVGSTGRSTGAHLHYEILKNGVHVNPANVKFTGSRTLAGNERARFNKQKVHMHVQLANIQQKSKDSAKLANNAHTNKHKSALQ